MDRREDNEGAMVPTGTYEATMARKKTIRQPDLIHWESDAAFRDQPYRQLHHQKGLMGNFKIRLLEAADLERSYWSALALGPIKHLGLSTAHGAVSSYCTFTMDTEPHNANTDASLYSSVDGKMPAKPTGLSDRPVSQPVVVSPVMPQDNNPVWSDFYFDMPLRKGSFAEDGMRIFLKVRMDEDAHVAEKIIPGLPKGDDRLLGRGKVDLTSLCLGEKLLGQPQVGVLDAWVPIYFTARDQEEQERQQHVMIAASAASLKAGSKQPSSSARAPAKRQVGRVRILVSYKPNGLEPKQNDIVALETFARRPLKRSTVTPILPPLMPLLVKEVRPPYLLVEYQLPVSTRATTRRSGNNRGERLTSNKACMRLHRNTVFVVERKNLVDTTVGLAMLPADVIMSTPFGQVGAQILGPALNAGKEILMPATLSFKLVFMALKTTTMAGWTGIQAAGGAIWQEGANAWTNQNEESRYNREKERASADVTQL